MRIGLRGEDLQQHYHESVLFDVNQLAFDLICSWSGERASVPDFPRLNIVFEGGEGVNEETQNVCVPLKHPAEEQVPLPIRELHLWLLLQFFQVSGSMEVPALRGDGQG